jgi:hypothetical protein
MARRRVGPALARYATENVGRGLERSLRALLLEDRVGRGRVRRGRRLRLVPFARRHRRRIHPNERLFGDVDIDVLLGATAPPGVTAINPSYEQDDQPLVGGRRHHPGSRANLAPVAGPNVSATTANQVHQI